ncbi:MAG TPA: glycosyltransferase family 39 protein [Thermomonas sp.]|nr:glycosyltransferase family 39 protein [Thermomonas sp.]
MLAAVFFLLFASQLWLHARNASATMDEPVHLLAGHRHLQCGDYAFNPEHPPLLKQLAAAPLQWMQVRMPEDLPCAAGFTPKAETFRLADKFLAENGGDRVLMPARYMAMLFSLLLAVLVGLAGWRMFGPWPGVAAMALFAMEPMLVAHGSLVTTDMAIAATSLLAVLVLYEARRWTPLPRLLAMGLAFGLMLASKHSAVLVLPMLALLVLLDAALWRDGRWRARTRLLQPAAELGAGLALAVLVLWACYGFRYPAAPGMAQTVDLAGFLQAVGKPETRDLLMAKLVPWLGRSGLLPESYLMGLADIVGTSVRWTRLLGWLYPQGQWSFFPIAFSIKTGIPLLLLLPLGIAFAWRDPGRRRALLFLLLPALGYFLVAMSSKVTVGIRHVLLVYPFFIVLAGYGLATLWQRGRAWPWLLTGLLAYQAVAVIRTAPDYIPFANALWGGPDRAYWALPFHNADWGQTPKRIGQYMAVQGTGACWVAGVVSPQPIVGPQACRSLPERRAWEQPGSLPDAIPPVIEGTIFVGVRMTSPRVGGPEYAPLLHRRHHMLAGAVMVHEGRFHMPALAAVGHAIRADALVRSGQVEQGIDEGRRGVALAAEDPRPWISLGDALVTAGRLDEAAPALAAARRAIAAQPAVYAFALPRLEQLAQRLATASG